MFVGYMSYEAVILLSRGGTIVCGFLPPEEYGEDVLSLLKKKNFLDKVVTLMLKEYEA